MTSRRDREEAARVSAGQQASGTRAEEYTLLALRTTDPVVREGAREMAAASNRSAGQTLLESLTDPRNEVTPAMRAARQALRDGA
ncbi:hypothetical protein ACQEU6_20535 [Spirillospora sp. CA-108201]